MPDGDVDYQTHALSISTEGVFDSTNVAPARLLQGENIIAVEVHQRSDDSSDVSFDLELVAQRLIGSPVVVDSVTFGQQFPNVSWGRDPNNDGSWSYFGEPTPNSANTTFATLTPVGSTPVEFSVANGFHHGCSRSDV